MAFRLQLAISRTHDLPAVEGRQEWFDLRGRLFAWSQGSATAGRIAVRGCGVFCFERDSSRVRAFARPEVEFERIRSVFRTVVHPLAIQTRGWHTLHASGVLTGGGVVVLCGKSGTGKSTLAQAWVEHDRKAELWCDDSLAFELGDRGPTTRRLGKAPRASRASNAARRLSALVVLEPMSNAATGATGATGATAATASTPFATLLPLAPAAALSSTLPHALCLDLQNGALARGFFHAYASLASSCAAYRLRYPRTAEALTDTAEKLAAAFAPGPATRSQAALDR